MKREINISVEDGVLQEVEYYAEKFGLSRSQMIQNMLTVSLADVKILKSVGLIDLSLMVRKVRENLGLDELQKAR